MKFQHLKQAWRTAGHAAEHIRQLVARVAVTKVGYYRIGEAPSGGIYQPQGILAAG